MDVQIRAPRADEAEAAFAVCNEAFASSRERRADWLAVKRMEDFLCAWEGDELVATTETIAAGQHFGGRTVPLGAVASVAVRPDHRGRGLAPRLLTTALEQMHERGLVVSTLHPATTAFYRRFGWEIGGEFGVRRLPAAALAALPRGEPECMRPATLDDHETVRDCYERIARRIDGSLHRSEPMWEAWTRSLDDPHQYLYVFDDGERLHGYVRYAQVRGRSQWGFAITVHELFAETPPAGVTLWRHLGSHAAQVDEITVLGARPDSLVLQLPEQSVRLVDANHWMTRLVDVRGAVAARGYPPAVTATIELEIADRVAPWNDDRFVLHVERGNGSLERGGRGDVHVTVNALASLYTGWTSAAALADSGALVGADERDLRALDAVFAGPPPALFDDF